MTEMAREFKQLARKGRWSSFNFLRNSRFLLKSLLSRIDSSSGWIRFPFYHHVFDDERQGFARQLDYMKNYGDFISLDEAVSLISQDKKIGRFFCLTFDDGFKNCMTNALPILVEKDIKAAFFIPVDYISSDAEKCREGNLRIWGTMDQPLVEFLTWDDCKAMVASGMTIGSHTLSHLNLTNLPIDEVTRELTDSKKKIESELKVPCNHFACPFGFPGLHFDSEIHTQIAKKTGYRSFLTTRRGRMYPGDSPYFIKRDWLLAEWENFRLRYLLASEFK